MHLHNKRTISEWSAAALTVTGSNKLKIKQGHRGVAVFQPCGIFCGFLIVVEESVPIKGTFVFHWHIMH